MINIEIHPTLIIHGRRHLPLFHHHDLRPPYIIPQSQPSIYHHHHIHVDYILGWFCKRPVLINYNLKIPKAIYNVIKLCNAERAGCRTRPSRYYFPLDLHRSHQSYSQIPMLPSFTMNSWQRSCYREVTKDSWSNLEISESVM